MRIPFASWSRRERMLLAACGTSLALSAAALLGLGGAVSTAGQRDLITGKDIAKNSITSEDVRKGGLRASDLGVYVVPSEIARNPGKGAGNNANANCHPGDQILGGGGSWLGGGPGLDTDSSAPAWYQNDRWTFSGNDYGGASNMVAFAICMKN
jgi:hypothetical protein